MESHEQIYLLRIRPSFWVNLSPHISVQFISLGESIYVCFGSSRRSSVDRFGWNLEWFNEHNMATFFIPEKIHGSLGINGKSQRAEPRASASKYLLVWAVSYYKWNYWNLRGAHVQAVAKVRGTKLGIPCRIAPAKGFISWGERV